MLKGERKGRRVLHTPAIKPLVEGSEGHQKVCFNIRYEVDILWEGAFTIFCLSFFSHLVDILTFFFSFSLRSIEHLSR